MWIRFIIYFSQDIGQRRDVVKWTMSFLVSKYAGNFVTNRPAIDVSSTVLNWCYGMQV
jgi:hypothetical protein